MIPPRSFWKALQWIKVVILLILMILFVQIAKSNESQSQLLPIMQTVTTSTKDTQNNSSCNTFKEEALSFGEKVALVNASIHEQWRPMKMQSKGCDIWNNVQNGKIVLHQTCSTLETQSEDEQFNKENIQMQSLSDMHSTIRIQRRSPLKDITSKALKTRSKMSKASNQQQLCAYMSSLFPSGKKDPFARQGKALRV